MTLAPGLIQAFSATVGGLVKVSTIYRYTHQLDSDQRSHFKGHEMQDWTKEHTGSMANKKEEGTITTAD